MMLALFTLSTSIIELSQFGRLDKFSLNILLQIFVHSTKNVDFRAKLAD
jgi:hypothetical protein